MEGWMEILKKGRMDEKNRRMDEWMNDV